ncbi:hypothetical protein JJE66_34670 [Bradyrhizobium diazoefficiens]|uniref:hypothetical protein n=1 Tax=Bradyrhizobium diazoefficiens TaxID=1355477 RepID=UPI0019099250|nr:hypothetical protein [Bradyrhizobium diazoefficiens]MBK3666345.1 hypothetical protein [Bradyrhizobium diazoefficiens]
MSDYGFFKSDSTAELLDKSTKSLARSLEWTSFFEEALFPRAMLYGILEELRWALVSFAMAVSSAPTTLEIAKNAFLADEFRDDVANFHGGRSPASHGFNKRG